MQHPPKTAPMAIPIAAELSFSEPDTDDPSELFEPSEPSGTAYVKFSTVVKLEKLDIAVDSPLGTVCPSVSSSETMAFVNKSVTSLKSTLSD